ncbi:MAG TPA: MBL fold metallo-hydrolase [Candidatus Olsenella avistercoris]|nr:MBL fold metallo-hydrolase [Candidatus Olsenella avistercoris]
MKDIKLTRGIADYVICAVGALFICAYLSMGFQPVARPADDPEPVAQEQQAEQEPAEAPAPAEPELADMTATFIDVGQGDSALVELPDGKFMLIDAGEASASQNVLDALDEADVDDIDYLVATHPHADHIGGMEAVLDAYEVGEVWMPDAPDTTETYEGFLDAVDAEGCPVEEATAGEEIVGEDAGYTVDVLAPSDDVDSEDMNDYSAIVKVTYGDTALLFTGDASAQEIVDANPGHVDVLKAAHHGSETGTNAEVMTETTPEFVVMSYAEGNSYGHPDQSTLDAVSAAGATAYSTAANGNVTATSDGEQVSVETEKNGTIVAGVSAEERAQQEAEAQAQAEAEAQAQAEAEAQAQQQQQQQVEPQEDMVVITQSGEKYHRPGCRTLSRSKNTSTVTRSEAEAMGLGPCGVCNP